MPAHASIDQIVAHLETADVAHFVCHGHLRNDNPLFSSVRLHGGDLLAYQLHGLRHPPRVAVLSACHLGLGPGPGESLLGFTDAFLSAGTSSVIASTLPVPDTTITVDLMVALHEHMAAGDGPATALAKAQGVVPGEVAPLYAAAFTCFGAG